MKRKPTIVALGITLLNACATVSPPQPKSPDETHRIPVNRVWPEEQASPKKKGIDDSPPATRVQWR
jgi:hypothetical protein